MRRVVAGVGGAGVGETVDSIVKVWVSLWLNSPPLMLTDPSAVSML